MAKDQKPAPPPDKQPDRTTRTNDGKNEGDKYTGLPGKGKK